MALFDAFCPGLKRCAALVLLLICSGCASQKATLFQVSGPDWNVREGQALWKPGRTYPEIGGDLVVASDSTGRTMVQFSKTPMTMATGQTSSKRWLIQFPSQGLGFTGHGKPPLRFTLLYLPSALRGDPMPKQIHFENKPDGTWRIENTKTGEVLEGYLSP